MLIGKNDISFTVARTRHCQFWRRLSAGEWEPHTFQILDRFVSRETTYLDVGAWIGPTALYAAQRAKRAVAFEPDPLAFKELVLNAGLNPQISNLRTCELFIGTGSGTVRIGSEKGLGNSTTSSLFPQSEQSCIARTIRLDEFVASERLEPPFFIKIDAEGAEFDILPQMAAFIAKYKPVVCLSLHAFFLDKVLRAGHRGFFLTRRLRCFEAHRRVVASLRNLLFRYDECGKRLNLTWGLLRTLFGKPFVRGNVIVAMETPWSESNGADNDNACDQLHPAVVTQEVVPAIIGLRVAQLQDPKEY